LLVIKQEKADFLSNYKLQTVPWFTQMLHMWT